MVQLPTSTHVTDMASALVDKDKRTFSRQDGIHVLGRHAYKIEHYINDEDNGIYECFAKAFAAKVTFDLRQYEELTDYLPKVFAAFGKLFYVFYASIESNKRLTKLRKQEDIARYFFHDGESA